jgi:flagellar hook-basal body complex protein FliE
MSDPLGLISGAGGLGGAGRLTGPQQARDVAPAEGAPSFKDVLLENIDQANRLQQEATAAAEDLATGKRADVEGVISATQKADAAFRMLLSVRNRMQTAFEEIKQIRV